MEEEEEEEEEVDGTPGVTLRSIDEILASLEGEEDTDEEEEEEEEKNNNVNHVYTRHGDESATQSHGSLPADDNEEEGERANLSVEENGYSESEHEPSSLMLMGSNAARARGRDEIHDTDMHSRSMPSSGGDDDDDTSSSSSSSSTEHEHEGRQTASSQLQYEQRQCPESHQEQKETEESASTSHDGDEHQLDADAGADAAAPTRTDGKASVPSTTRMPAVHTTEDNVQDDKGANADADAADTTLDASDMSLRHYEDDARKHEDDDYNETNHLRSFRSRSINLVNEILTSVDDDDTATSPENIGIGDEDKSTVKDDATSLVHVHTADETRERAVAASASGDPGAERGASKQTHIEPLLSRALRAAAVATEEQQSQAHEHSTEPMTTASSLDDDGPVRAQLVRDVLRRLDPSDEVAKGNAIALSERISFAALARQTEIGRFGVPQCLCVGNRCMGVGFSSGTVFVVSRKAKTLLEQHSLPEPLDRHQQQQHYQERWDAFVALPLPPQLLTALHSQRRKLGVSSVGFSPSAEMLLAGYESGLLLLWDVSTKRVLSEMQNMHAAPVMAVCSTSSDPTPSQMDTGRGGRDAPGNNSTNTNSSSGGGGNNSITIFVTADTMGTAHVHSIVRRGLLNKIHVSTRTLLDGRKGLVHAIAALPPPIMHSHPQARPSNASTETQASTAARNELAGVDATKSPAEEDVEAVLVGIALSESVLVVRFAPEPVSTLTKIRRPEGLDDCVVHLAWRRRYGRGANALLPALIISWGSFVEVVMLSGASANVVARTHVYTSSEPPRALGWLDDRLVAVVMGTQADVYEEEEGEQTQEEAISQLQPDEVNQSKEHGSGGGDATTEEVVDAPRTDVDSSRSRDNHTLRYSELASVRLSEAPAASEAVAIQSMTSTNQRCFCHSSCASPGQAVYWQGIQTAVWRLNLRSWPQRINAFRSQGKTGAALAAALTVHWKSTKVVPGAWPPREATNVVVANLLKAYIASLCALVANDGGEIQESANIENKQMLENGIASVVEVCVLFPATIGLLWDSLCPSFLASDAHRGIFLDVLSGYISQGLLPQAGPEVVQALVEYHVARGRTALVETCVVQLDIASLDFNQLMLICRTYNLFNVMIHLLAGGLGDYLTPAQELLRAVRSMLVSAKVDREARSSSTTTTSSERDISERDSQILSTRAELERCGGTLLVYILQCVSGQRFPVGRGAIDPSDVARIRKEIIALILDDAPDKGRLEPLAWLRLLLQLDAQGTFRILRAARTAGAEYESRLVTDALVKLMRIEEKEDEEDDGMDAVDEQEDSTGSMTLNVPSGVARRGRGGILAPQMVSDAIIKDELSLPDDDVLLVMTSLAKSSDGSDVETMLQHVLRNGDAKSRKFLEHAKTLAEAYQLRGVSLVIATVGGRPDEKVVALLQGEHDTDEIFTILQRVLAWESEWRNKRSSSRKNSTEKVELTALGKSIISHVDNLISLDGGRTARLILNAFGQEASFHVLRDLESPELQFEYIRSVMNELGVATFGEKNSVGGLDEKEGSGAFADMLARSGLEVTPELSELYIRLLCKFRPTSVLSFLQAQHVVFRPDVCVRYCEEAGVMDAAAKLYEDMGFDAKAMHCLLEVLSPPLDDVEAAVHTGHRLNLPRAGSEQLQSSRAFPPSTAHTAGAPLSHTTHVPTLLRQAARSLEACISLAVRTGHRSASSEEATELWFRVIRSLVVRISRVPPKSDLYAMYALLMNDVLSAMMSDGQVPRDVIFDRLSKEFGSNHFGGFRGVFTGVLCAAEFEYVIYSTTRSILEADSYERLRTLHAERRRALPSRQVTLSSSRVFVASDNAGAADPRHLHRDHHRHHYSRSSSREDDTRSRFPPRTVMSSLSSPPPLRLSPPTPAIATETRRLAQKKNSKKKKKKKRQSAFGNDGGAEPAFSGVLGQFAL